MLAACPAALLVEPDAATDVDLAVLGWLEDALFLGGAVGGAEDVGGGWFPAVDLEVAAEAAAEAAAVAGPDTAATAWAVCQLEISVLTKCRRRSRYWLYSSTSL